MNQRWLLLLVPMLVACSRKEGASGSSGESPKPVATADEKKEAPSAKAKKPKDDVAAAADAGDSPGDSPTDADTPSAVYDGEELKPASTKYPNPEVPEPAAVTYARSGPADAGFQFHLTPLPTLPKAQKLTLTYKSVPSNWTPYKGKTVNYAGLPLEYVTAKKSVVRDYQYADGRPGGHLLAVWHDKTFASAYGGLESAVLDTSNRYAFTQASAVDESKKYATDSVILDVDTLETHHLPLVDCVGQGRWMGPRLITYSPPADAKKATPICVFSRTGELLTRLEATPHKAATFDFFGAQLGVVRGDPHLFYAVDSGSIGPANELYVLDLRTGDAFRAHMPGDVYSEDYFDISGFTFADPKVRVSDAGAWKTVTLKKDNP